jgi:L-cysteate sulfo-lyase
MFQERMMHGVQRPRFCLLGQPTPIERLVRLEEALGKGCPAIYVKRDDMMSVGGGGNWSS